jgi:hypothetical protein
VGQMVTYPLCGSPHELVQAHQLLGQVLGHRLGQHGAQLQLPPLHRTSIQNIIRRGACIVDARSQMATRGALTPWLCECTETWSSHSLSRYSWLSNSTWRLSFSFSSRSTEGDFLC